MKSVFVAAHNITSPLGNTSEENFLNMCAFKSGCRKIEFEQLSDNILYASIFSPDNKRFEGDSTFTKFEKLLIHSIQNVVNNNIDFNPFDERTLLIISSTKGNIDLLIDEKINPEIIERASLLHSSKLIATYFRFKNQPLIISTACVSGVLSLITGMRLIQSGHYENVIVVGADVVSRFVVSGFSSFQALSNEQCKPFDKDRTGINLGEGAAAIILTSNEKYSKGINIIGGSTTNDANHISGPSRTGAELSLAINNALFDAGINISQIDFVSAHGTGTIYNDEMEANAFNLSGINSSLPVNSFKGYFGHTLGLAGIIESIICFKCIENEIILPTLGFNELGVSKPINVVDNLIEKSIKYCLKTASGFGGGNAAVIIGNNYQ